MTDLVEKITEAVFTADGWQDYHASREAVRATIRAIQDNGYAIVPLEPTGNMLSAGSHKQGAQVWELTYRAMLAAAPPIGDEG